MTTSAFLLLELSPLFVFEFDFLFSLLFSLNSDILSQTFYFFTNGDNGEPCKYHQIIPKGTAVTCTVQTLKITQQRGIPGKATLF